MGFLFGKAKANNEKVPIKPVNQKNTISPQKIEQPK